MLHRVHAPKFVLLLIRTYVLLSCFENRISMQSKQAASPYPCVLWCCRDRAISDAKVLAAAEFMLSLLI
jgi:hypothetical protein